MFVHVRTSEYPAGKYSLAFLKIAGAESPCLELTYNWGVDSYELGNGYGHMAFRVESMSAFEQHIKKHGVDFSWGPSINPSGDRGMAFLKDPDGYSVEILSERP
jgi:lactoylglutathione lyase